MSETNLLLKAYYEALYERLEAGKDLITARASELLREEMTKRWPGEFDEEKYMAYRDACIAFVDERIEYYNPVGIQYVFDRAKAWEAFELELQLNWYDSRAEFAALVEAAHEKAERGLSEETLRLLADELIAEVGAFPEKSIISTYEAQPAMGKLPDYVVARAIKEIIK
jgi:hypothetical protein